MGFVFETTHSVYLTASLLCLVTIGRADVLAVGNPSKEIDTWKGKCEAIEKISLLFIRI